MKVAEGLLLRKQLEAKVAQLTPLKQLGENGIWKQEVSRKSVNENVDEVSIVVPRITLADLTGTYDHYASELRKLDAAIQQANWTNELDFKEWNAPVTEIVKAD